METYPLFHPTLPTMPRRRRRENPVHRKIRNMMDYDALFKRQRGRCAICKRKWEPVLPSGRRARRMHRDHNHEHLYPRGLLCYRCNVRLRGAVTAEWCRAAARYLARYEKENESGE